MLKCAQEFSSFEQSSARSICFLLAEKSDWAPWLPQSPPVKPSPVERAASSLLPERNKVAGAARRWAAKWKELGSGMARAFSSCFHLSLARLMSESLARAQTSLLFTGQLLQGKKFFTFHSPQPSFLRILQCLLNCVSNIVRGVITHYSRRFNPFHDSIFSKYGRHSAVA